MCGFLADPILLALVQGSLCRSVSLLIAPSEPPSSEVSNRSITRSSFSHGSFWPLGNFTKVLEGYFEYFT